MRKRKWRREKKKNGTGKGKWKGGITMTTEG